MTIKTKVVVRTGNTAQWWNGCLASAGPELQFPTPHQVPKGLFTHFSRQMGTQLQESGAENQLNYFLLREIGKDQQPDLGAMV